MSVPLRFPKCDNCDLGGKSSEDYPIPCPSYKEGATCGILKEIYDSYEKLNLDDPSDFKKIAHRMIKTLMVNAEMGDFAARCGGKPGHIQSRSDLTPAVNLMNMCITLNKGEKDVKADPMKEIARKIGVMDDESG